MLICSLFLWGMLSLHVLFDLVTHFYKLLTIALSIIDILFIILGKCLEASWSCSPNCTSRIVQNICCICVQSKAGCAFVETKSWSRRRKGKMKMNLLIVMKLLIAPNTIRNNRFILSYSNANTNIYWEWKVGYLGLPRDICLQTRRT